MLTSSFAILFGSEFMGISLLQLCLRQENTYISDKYPANLGSYLQLCGLWNLSNGRYECVWFSFLIPILPCATFWSSYIHPQTNSWSFVIFSLHKVDSQIKQLQYWCPWICYLFGIHPLILRSISGMSNVDTSRELFVIQNLVETSSWRFTSM